MVLYLRGVDTVSHAAMKYSNLYTEVSSASEMKQRYGQVISSYYAYVFKRLRRLVEMAGSHTVTVIASDHGFRRQAKHSFGHEHAPHGILIAVNGRDSGQRAQDDSEATIYDIAPTILWLSGYPIARDMPGRALRDRFAEWANRIGPPIFISTHGLRRHLSRSRVDPFQVCNSSF